jgi:hypothetical protein
MGLRRSEKPMTLFERINQAKSRQELSILQMEIILDQEHFTENKKAFIERLKELGNNDNTRNQPAR